MRAKSQSRSPSRSLGFLPPIGAEAALPVSRMRLVHLMALDTLTECRSAALAQDWPLKTVATTRSRKSRE
jgi:hypothetical protein